MKEWICDKKCFRCFGEFDHCSVSIVGVVGRKRLLLERRQEVNNNCIVKISINISTKILTQFSRVVYNTIKTNRKGAKSMSEMSVMGMMKNIVPITRFNRGEANRIFDEVEASGTKIVMKNNQPACVLMSPGQYEALMEMLSDYILLQEAEARMSAYDPAESRTQQEMMDELGITAEELADVDVEIE